MCLFVCRLKGELFKCCNRDVYRGTIGLTDYQHVEAESDKRPNHWLLAARHGCGNQGRVFEEFFQHGMKMRQAICLFGS